jgi:hypothetical protein
MNEFPSGKWFPAMMPAFSRPGEWQSCPIQDEPEGGVGFQHKMSLEKVAC